MYMVQLMRYKLTVGTFTGETEIDLSWADGMIGACPVFKTKEQAEEYADGSPIVEIVLPDGEIMEE